MKRKLLFASLLAVIAMFVGTIISIAGGCLILRDIVISQLGISYHLVRDSVLWFGGYILSACGVVLLALCLIHTNEETIIHSTNSERTDLQ